MVGSSDNTADRTDALAGLSLVENLARMSTSECARPIQRLTGRLRISANNYVKSTALVFGIIFAAFAGIGRTELVFTCNAVSDPKPCYIQFMWFLS